MPELPEVETIRRDLQLALTGEVATRWDVFDARLIPPSQAPYWKKCVLRQPWRTFHRKGKYFWVELGNGYKIVFHMRMTGQLLIQTTSTKQPRPLPAARSGEGVGQPRMRIQFANGKTLAFYDQRRFGEVWLLAPGENWRGRNPLGPDALDEMDKREFARIVKQKTTRIQPLLMDQRILAGVGNIYAQEALFKAHVRPNRPANRLTQAEADRLYDALGETLRTAIELRGSTSRNYRDAYGQAGAAQSVHAVYRKSGAPCVRCGMVLRAIRVGGRGSVYCPQCQK